MSSLSGIQCEIVESEFVRLEFRDNDIHHHEAENESHKNAQC